MLYHSPLAVVIVYIDKETVKILIMIILFFSKETNKEKEKSITDSSVTVDLSKLSRTKKLQLLKRESPEFMPLLEDFKGKAAKAHPALQKMGL